MWLAWATTLAGIAVSYALFHLYKCKEDRRKALPPTEERIVILGASSSNGIGAAIARQCLARGARHIMLVGRRSDALREVQLALTASQDTPDAKARASQIQLFVADCTDEEDVLRLATTIATDFGGIDTLYIVFGMICTQSLLGLADLDPLAGAQSAEPTLDGLQSVSRAMQQVNAANITGTSLVLAALLPHMQTRSKHPYVAVVGSLAALVPAPTRALYCATKTAQQMLVQGVAAECASQARVAGRALVRFVTLAPSTVSTSFALRLAVGSQGPRPRESHSVLSADDVAQAAIQSVDQNTTGVVPVPYKYFFVWLLAPLLPKMVEQGAHRRYGY